MFTSIIGTRAVINLDLRWQAGFPSSQYNLETIRMQIFKKETRIDFMGKRKIAMVVSLVLLLIAIGSVCNPRLELWHRLYRRYFG